MGNDRYKSYLWAGYAVVVLLVAGYIVYSLWFRQPESTDIPKYSEIKKPTPEEIAKRKADELARTKQSADIEANQARQAEALRKSREALARRRASGTPEVSKTAAIYEKASTKELIEQFENAKFTMIKNDILTALAERKDPAAVEPLMEKLQDKKYAPYRDKLVRVLVNSGTDETRKTLWKMGYLKDKDKVSGSTGSTGTTPAVTPVSKDNGNPAGTAEKVDEKAVNNTLVALSVGKMKPEEGVPLLLSVLRSDRKDLYQDVSIALKQLSPKKDFPVLPNTTTPEEASRVADEWEKKLMDSIKNK